MTSRWNPILETPQPGITKKGGRSIKSNSKISFPLSSDDRLRSQNRRLHWRDKRCGYNQVLLQFPLLSSDVRKSLIRCTSGEVSEKKTRCWRGRGGMRVQCSRHTYVLVIQIQNKRYRLYIAEQEFWERPLSLKTLYHLRYHHVVTI